MQKHNWTDITYDDVLQAIKKFDCEEPDHPEPKSTFLVFAGKKYPAKHIRGMAYKEHYGAEISKSDYNGGAETVRFFNRLGFEVYYNGRSESGADTNDTNKEINARPHSPQSGTSTDTEITVASEEKRSVKVALYLQTESFRNSASFRKMKTIIGRSDCDVLVFPECCYFPSVYSLWKKDVTVESDLKDIYRVCLNLSRELGKAIIVSRENRYGVIYSVFANADAAEGDTEVSLYIKHTMCETSCLSFENYDKTARCLFAPVKYKGFLIGMTICYDCNHALFSRIYGLQQVDLIVNCTGGNVVYDKWFKYNKARAIENNCSVLVTMGGEDYRENNNSYVYGFNKNGGQLKPINLCGDSNRLNVPGGIYVYEVTRDPGLPEPDESNKTETANKYWHMKWPVKGSKEILRSAEKITESIYRLEEKEYNVFILLVDGMDILKPEIVQRLLYSDTIKRYPNRKYIILNRHGTVDTDFFADKISVILKVRSMENFCAVILESDHLNKCYQCGNNRSAQVVEATAGCFRIDLNRTTGPDAIWKNKEGMSASWRKNYEWLTENAESIAKSVLK